MKPTKEQFEAYQLIFDYFNKYLFKSELPQCILNLSRLNKAHGFFAPNRWKQEGSEKTLHEISLNPDSLSRAPKVVLSTLAHEMCHLWQQERGTPPRKAYHDKQFANKMFEIGLQTSHDGTEFGKPTGQKMTHVIIANGIYERVFDTMPKQYLLPFVHIHIEDEAKKEKQKNKIKYTCPDCDTSVWGKPGLNLVCGDCEINFKAEETDENDN